MEWGCEGLLGFVEFFAETALKDYLAGVGRGLLKGEGFV